MGNAKILDFRQSRGSSQMADVREETTYRAPSREKFDRFEWMRGWLRDERIPSATTVAVLAALFDHMNKGGQCWPSQGTLASLAHCSERSVRTHLETAEELGWIATKRRGNNSSIYQAATPSSIEPTTTQNKDDQPEAVATRKQLPPGNDCRKDRKQLPERPETIADKQTKEQTKEQTTSSAGAGEENLDCMWSDEFGMEPIPETDRPQPKGVADYWRQKTGESIKFMAPTGRGRHLRDICRHFNRATVKEHIDKATEPGIDYPWSFFVGCLKRIASGEGEPTKETRRTDRVEESADRCMKMIDELVGQGGAQ